MPNPFPRRPLPAWAIAVVLFWLAGGSAAQAAVPQLAEIHLAQDGDDRAAGSVSRPWKTLKQALARVAPSGRIVLGNGVWYEGELVLEQSGTAEQPLVIEGAGADQTWIAGSKPVTGWTKDRSGVWSVPWTVNSQVVTSDGVLLQQVGNGCHWHDKQEWANKPTLKPVGTGISDVTPGRFFVDEAGKRLHCRLADDQDPNQHLLEAAVARWVLQGGPTSTHVVLRGIGFRQSSGSARKIGNWARMVTLGPEAWTVEDCAIAQGDFIGIEVAGLHHRILRTVIRDNGDVGLNCNNRPAPKRTAGSWPPGPELDLLIQGCTITGNNARGFDYNWHAGGMKLIPTARGVTVADCVVSDNRGHGIWFDTCQGGNLIAGNTVERNKAGIMVEISKPVEGDVTCATIRRNLVRGNTEQGIYVSASQGVLVERNTLWGNWCNLVLHGLPRSETGADKQPIAMSLSGNIARGNLIGEAAHADLILFTGAGAADNVVDGNFYGFGKKHPVTGQRTTMRAGLVTGPGYAITAFALASLTKVGVETHGVGGDPRFTDPQTLTPAADGPAAGYGR